MISRIVFTTLAVITILLAGCAQRESSVGSTALSSQAADTFVVVSGRAAAGASVKPRFSNGGSGSLEVGEANGLLSFFAIQFDAVTGVPDSIQVDSARMRLYRSTSWPNRGFTSILVRVREVKESWTELGLLPDSLPGRENYPVLDSVLASTTDSMFNYDVPPAIFNKWFAQDSSTHGLVVEAASQGAFIEYYSRNTVNAVHPEYAPRLIVHGRQWLMNADSTWRDSAWTAELYAINDGYLVKDTEVQPPERLFITQGLAERIALYFPVDTLAKFTRQINRAEIHLYADTLHAANIRYPSENPVLEDGVMQNRLWIAHPDSVNLGSENTIAGEWDVTGTEVVMNISNSAAGWALDSTVNYGVQIRSLDELGKLARFVFHSNLSEDSTKRPKLVIWYTESLR